jgi:hypothetical protein
LAESDIDLWAVTSDHHAGSTVSLCPPSVDLDDGGSYQASRAQAWLWQCWRDFWDEAARVRDRLNANLLCAYNGDLVEGDHHGTSQIISRHPGIEQAVARRVLDVPQALAPDYSFVVRGTESHVGKSGKAEEALAAYLGAEGDPESGTNSWWHLRVERQGVPMDFAHHGRMGQRPWTKANATSMLAAQIFYEHAERGEKWPRLAFRSHYHQWQDSHLSHPVRVIQTPAWQLKTAYVHKVAPESLADVGGALAIVRDGEIHSVRPILFTPKRGAVWTGSKSV